MSRYLLDTNALYWLVNNDPSMGPTTRARLASAAYVAYSAASVWELEIKRMTGRIHRATTFGSIAQGTGLSELPITAAHAGAIAAVALPHQDPFDRMLLTQAAVEGAILVTSDRVLLSLSRTDIVDARL